LTHLPIVIAIAYGLVLPRVPTGTPTFLVLVVILVPTTIVFARLFAAVFELPFQRHRSWNSLVQAITRRPRQPRNPTDELPPGSVGADAVRLSSESGT
jgi:peptidoglycan/LPS O-acetylase OafA/YrhL